MSHCSVGSHGFAHCHGVSHVRISSIKSMAISPMVTVHTSSAERRLWHWDAEEMGMEMEVGMEMEDGR